MCSEHLPSAEDKGTFEYEDDSECFISMWSAVTANLGYLFKHRENSSLFILSCFRKMWSESLWNHKEYEFNSIILQMSLCCFLHASPPVSIPSSECTHRCRDSMHITLPACEK